MVFAKFDGSCTFYVRVSRYNTTQLYISVFLIKACVDENKICYQINWIIWKHVSIIIVAEILSLNVSLEENNRQKFQRSFLNRDLNQQSPFRVSPLNPYPFPNI